LDRSAFADVTSYSYVLKSFVTTIPLATEGMTASIFYQFQLAAVNSVGISANSGASTYGAADLPTAPTELV
jgi:hypothetical protein